MQSWEFCDRALFGMVSSSDPLRGWTGDLQLRNQKVTLHHLPSYICIFWSPPEIGQFHLPCEFEDSGVPNSSSFSRRIHHPWLQIAHPISQWFLLGGSSLLGYAVNNHGDRFRPLRIGLFSTPSKWPNSLHGIYPGGPILTTYKSLGCTSTPLPGSSTRLTGQENASRFLAALLSSSCLTKVW